MKKIVIAPDSFKESLSALEVANAIENGLQKIYPETTFIKIPLADGGEGTVQSLVAATGGKIIEKKVLGPLEEKVDSFFGILGDGKTAVIEMAAASGLHLLPPQKRNPLLTTTWGTGELIRAALDYGVEHLIIGIGGSATNDGGAGMAQALGAKLLDENGLEIKQGGGNLNRLAKIDISELDQRLENISIEIACDVDNPLTGPQGASAVYGPQKGATAKMIDILDKNLLHYAAIIKKDLSKNIKDIPGSGAAGGLGAGLLAFTNAVLKPGIEIMIKTTQLVTHLQGADLVFTGEGRIDSQTIYGKTPVGVARAAKKYNIPVIALAGSVSDDYHVVYDHGIDAVFSIVPGIVSLEESMQNAPRYISQVVENIARLFKSLLLK